MKNITIAGNLTRDAETRQTQKGDSVTSLSVAVNERGNDARAYFFDVSLWGRRGEALAGYLNKGRQVVVTGSFATREYEGKTYLQVRADDVTLMGGGQDRPAPVAGGGRAPMQDPLDGDEIPFAPEYR